MVESIKTFDKLDSISQLKTHYDSELSKTHLRDLLSQDSRNQHLRASLNDEIFLDFTHVKIDEQGF